MSRLKCYCIVFCIGIPLLSSGCAPVADPRDGGLFGYSPDLYEQRAKERKQKLKKVETEIEIKQNNNRILHDDLKAQGLEIERLQSLLGSLDSELITLQKKIKEMHHSNKKAQAKQAEISLRIKEILDASKRANWQVENGMLTDKESEIQRLKEKLNGLVAEAELLGQL